MLRKISVQYLCQLSGLTIAQLAEVLKVHQQTLYRHNRNEKDLLETPQCREVLNLLEKHKEVFPKKTILRKK